MKAPFCIYSILILSLAAFPATPNYSIEAIRYGTIPQFPVAELVVGAPKNETLDIAMVFWLVQGEGRRILLDTGFHRQRWFENFKITDFLKPDEAVRQAGVDPAEITDIILSHAHWDHMGGIDLFPQATVWIQKDEYDYYMGPAWQKGGESGGIDPDDLAELLLRNTRGKVTLIDGDVRSHARDRVFVAGGTIHRNISASREILCLAWTIVISIETSNRRRSRRLSRLTPRPTSKLLTGWGLAERRARRAGHDHSFSSASRRAASRR
jgi:hypothetical protein